MALNTTTPQTSLANLELVSPAMPKLPDGSSADTLSVDVSALPFTIAADLDTIIVERGIGTDVQRITTFVEQGGVRLFSGIIPLEETEQTQVQFVGRNYVDQQVWTANTVYSLGTRVYNAATGKVYEVITSGRSGVNPPTWTDTTTSDNTVEWTYVGSMGVTPTLLLNLLSYVSQSSLTIAPPSGVTSYKAQDVCRLEWVQPNYEGVIGVRVQISTDPTGVVDPYRQYGDLVSKDTISRTENVVIGETTPQPNPQPVDPDTGIQTTVITTVQQTKAVNFCSIDIPKANVGNVTQFYAVLSTVVQDPFTNAVYESQQIGPVTCGYVDLKKVTPTDFLALQRKEDIAKRLIAQMTRFYPDLDLSPRSELRDLLIDPVSLELSNMSVREWFSRVSQSPSALSQIDDADGDGFSDDFSASPVKQQIARAYGLNATDTQSLIDRQFDILGEQAGLTRGGATASVVTLTFYTYIRPTSTISLPVGTVVSTIPDAQTPSLNFSTTTSATVDVGSANTFYDPINGWWSVNAPALCNSTGSYTNVGAGAIRSVVTGLPSGWNVTNQVGADFGRDEEINSKFAARIANRLVKGIDSGTRSGYLSTALKTPGIIGANVVAAGDTEMLRDWDDVRQKHVFGCVDIYTRGTSFSQQVDTVPFQYETSNPLVLEGHNFTWQNRSGLVFNIKRTTSEPTFPFYTGTELVVSAPGMPDVYLGLDRAQFSGDTIIVHPDDAPYQWVGDNVSKVKTDAVTGAANTNSTVVQNITSTKRSTASFKLKARYLSPLSHTPDAQPLIKVASVSGEDDKTGVVSQPLINLVRTTDFLTYGGSSKAGDRVDVLSNVSAPTTNTIVASTDAPVAFGSAVDVAVNADGTIGNVNSVRSTDGSILYQYGIDYSIEPTGQYHAYGLKVKTTSANITGLQVSNRMLTLQVKSRYGVGSTVAIEGLTTATYLNGSNLTIAEATSEYVKGVCPVFPENDVNSIPETGRITGSSIQNGQQVVVGFNQYALSEKLALVNEDIVLTATGVLLSHGGFINNTWLPLSYGRTDLTLDGWNGEFVTNATGDIVGLDNLNSTGLVGARVPHDSRYIKVTYNGQVLKENTDFLLRVDATTGQASLVRIPQGNMREDGLVSVSYFVSETFSIATQYPSFVQILTSVINDTKHAAADVLVKSMIPSPVDITLMVVLDQNAAPETMDARIRTVIGRVLDNADSTLYQSEIVRQVKAITGVQSVQLPLVRCAKSDGAYNIGVVVPTQTSWKPIGEDTAFTSYSNLANTYISTLNILPDNTIPSGGLASSVVTMLNLGTHYTRALSIQEFLTSSTSPMFYIIGQNDRIDANTPLGYEYSRRILLRAPKPSESSYLVTYQVFNEGGASDVTVSSTEYLVPGRITVNYVSGR